MPSLVLLESDAGGWWLAPFPGCPELGLLWFNWWVSFAPEFQCCYFCESSCLFYLSFNFDFYVSKIIHLWVGSLPRRLGGWMSGGGGGGRAGLGAGIGQPQAGWAPQ